MLMVVVTMIHPGITALPIISGETVGIERVAGSVVLAVRGRIKLRAGPGILDDGLRSRWTCERRCQQRSAKDCKFCHERPRRVGFSGRRTPRLRACSPRVPSRPIKSACKKPGERSAQHSPGRDRDVSRWPRPARRRYSPSQAARSVIVVRGTVHERSIWRARSIS